MTTPVKQRDESVPRGALTMSPAMREMPSYCEYLFERVQPALGQRVWEIGVGFGTYTALLRKSNRAVLATDIDAACLQAVAARFDADPLVSIARIDLTDEATVRAQSTFGADSILCLNVLEHIPDDVAALRWLRAAAAPRAGLGLVVPAHPALFGRMDAEAGHFRRYTRASLKQALQAAGWSVERLRYINFGGAVGWWYHNRVRRTAGLQDATVNRQMASLDRWIARTARWTDPWLGWLGGLSVLALARSRDDAAHL
jgi:SAM-dependent methyltransferase